MDLHLKGDTAKATFLALTPECGRRWSWRWNEMATEKPKHS